MQTLNETQLLKREIAQLTEQLYNSYKRIGELVEENEYLKQEFEILIKNNKF